jgi:hypothetical protein
MTTFADLSEMPPSDSRPPLDRECVDESGLDGDQLFWRNNGYLILRNFIPHDLIDAYCGVRAAKGEWHHPHPFLWVKEIRDLALYPPLMAKLKSLIHEEMAMSLNLTGWASTERNWHQDDYLNPPLLKSRYAACWFALDDIHPDSGPFEFVPGSNRWPVLRRSKVQATLPLSRRYLRSWATDTQDVIASLVNSQIRERGAKVEQFLGAKGDVLIWHSCLMHRGSAPKARGMLRLSLIAHYAAMTYATHFPKAVQHDNGGWYYKFTPAGTNRFLEPLRRLRAALRF